MRGACIDIGSNTTRLLVADIVSARVSAVHHARAYTGLGREVSATGQISPVKLAEAADVVSRQLQEARSFEAERIICVATAAVRRAGNAAELTALIERQCDGLEVSVLAEEQEARLAFLGALRSLRGAPRGPLGLVDVGGGSTEMVVGDPETGVSWWRSVPIGSGVLSADCLRGDPPGADELARARAQVEEALAGVNPPRTALTVAVGGSAAAMFQMTGNLLDVAALESALERLAREPLDQVATETNLEPERVRLLPAGLLILLAAARRFGQPLLVGVGGLREGVLLSAAGA